MSKAKIRMGHVGSPSWLTLAACLAASPSLVACKNGGTDSTTGTSRSDAVRVATSAVASTAAPSAQAHDAQDAATTTTKAPRALCTTKPAGAGRALPDLKFDHLEAAGEEPLPAHIDPPTGHWTWVNFWAGWCGPCREEMPRLAAFARSDANVRVAFVSLDDDERQAKLFLDAQPTTSVRKSHWLRDDKARMAMFDPLRIEGDPTLPMHLLFGPDGKLRCRIDGAIEDRDLPTLHKLFAGR